MYYNACLHRIVPYYTVHHGRIAISGLADVFCAALIFEKCSIQHDSIKSEIIVHLNNVSVHQLNEMC